MNINALITAGGSSRRFGNTNKLLECVNGQEILLHTVNAFLKVSEIIEVVIAANISIIEEIQVIFAKESKVRVILGGQTRQESVYNGLKSIESCDYVLIHDGARPMISPEIIKQAIYTVKDKKALTVAAKTIDTIKQVDENLKIIKTIDRSSLYNTQTPQAFDFKLIKNAHETLKGQSFTDDAGMLEHLGIDVYVIEGDYKNIKITTQSDLELAKIYL